MIKNWNEYLKYNESSHSDLDMIMNIFKDEGLSVDYQSYDEEELSVPGSGTLEIRDDIGYGSRNLYNLVNSVIPRLESMYDNVGCSLCVGTQSFHDLIKSWDDFEEYADSVEGVHIDLNC